MKHERSSDPLSCGRAEMSTEAAATHRATRALLNYTLLDRVDILARRQQGRWPHRDRATRWRSKELDHT